MVTIAKLLGHTDDQMRVMALWLRGWRLTYRGLWITSSGAVTRASASPYIAEASKLVKETTAMSGSMGGRPTPRETLVLNVWEKGKVIKDLDPDEWRLDAYGNFIRLDEYGNRNSQHGWEIDHIDPDGGPDHSNLRPLQWANVQRN